MTTETAKIETVTKKRSLTRRLLKGTLILVGVFAAFLLAAHMIWKYSGTSKWQPEMDKSGVKIYSLKVPGSTLKRFRAVTRVKTTMNRAVAALNDYSIENCAQWVPGCAISKEIQPWNSQGLYSLTYYRMNFNFPISPRELVLKMQYSQDSQSKAVTIDARAIPDMIPQTKGCVLIVHMHNRWRWTPLKDGEVEAEVTSDVDPRFPYFITNSGRVPYMFHIFSNLQAFLDKKRYDKVTFPFIQEPPK
jgi:hypothetical protein